MDNNSKCYIGIRDKNSGKELSKEQIDYLFSLLRQAGIDLDSIIERKKASGEQTLTFEDELIIEVYDKNGKLKDRRVI